MLEKPLVEGRLILFGNQGLVAAAVPLALAYSTFGAEKSEVLGPCDALTPEQVAALVAKLFAAANATSGEGNCSLANLTIVEVLSLD